VYGKLTAAEGVRSYASRLMAQSSLATRTGNHGKQNRKANGLDVSMGRKSSPGSSISYGLPRGGSDLVLYGLKRKEKDTNVGNYKTVGYMKLES